jgi:cytochrome o ubiquinol oxidase operon protein cyoD
MSSKTPLKSHSHSAKEHGSTLSYIIGFILSLIFTLIPYYLVVNKTVTGTTLITAILGFGVIQMLIQIFFFLHLGRGPKPWYNIVFFAATVSIILVVVGGSIFIMDHLHYNMSPSEVTKKLAQKEGLEQIGGEKTGACQEIGANHKVIIKNGVVAPAYTEARLCDTLTFINEDDVVREIAFGGHPNHDSYSGEADIKVQSRPKSITLNEPGQFIFHDHLDPSTSGHLSVVD